MRSDVNVIMFDEPLTVIDPHLKWQLRSKLKQLHQQVGTTMIYVTHDQTEALTFADRVVVMFEGKVVQVGTPVELFERPQHTFVGHFIGSPGMNVLPARLDRGRMICLGSDFGPVDRRINESSKLEVGVRPEFVRFSTDGIPARINKVDDLGRYQIADVEASGQRLRLIVAEGESIPSEGAGIRFDPLHTHHYQDGWLVGLEGNTP